MERSRFSVVIKLKTYFTPMYYRFAYPPPLTECNLCFFLFDKPLSMCILSFWVSVYFLTWSCLAIFVGATSQFELKCVLIHIMCDFSLYVSVLKFLICFNHFGLLSVIFHRPLRTKLFKNNIPFYIKSIMRISQNRQNFGQYRKYRQVTSFWSLFTFLSSS